MTFLPASAVLLPAREDARLADRKKEFLCARGFLSEKDGFTLRGTAWGDGGASKSRVATT